MKLKKMLPLLVEKIQALGWDQTPRVLQAQALSGIKSGIDHFIIAPEGAGKSTVLNIAVIQQLKQAEEKAPRAIIIVENKDKAFAMDEQFEMLAEGSGLRSLIVYDEGHIDYQKDMIYEGIDLLITTPKRLNELINITGVPLVALKMLVVDDGETLFDSQNHTIIHRIVDGMEKVQVVIAANAWVSKFDDLAERAMKFPKVVEEEEE